MIFNSSGVAAECDHSRLQIGIERAAFFNGGRGGEDDFCGLRSKLFAVFRRARLHENRRPCGARATFNGPITLKCSPT